MTTTVTGRWAYTRVRMAEVFAYRFELFMLLLNPIMQLLLLAAVWTAVYDGRSSADGVPITVMTSYVTLSMTHSLLLRDDTVRWVEQRVRTGLIGMDLVRPIPLLQQQLLGQLSQVLVKLPLLVVAFPVALLVTGLVPPASATAGGVYVLSSVLGWLVNSCVMLLIAAVSFWTLEMGGMTFLFFVISHFLSGALVPLWFMPDWLRTILEWLPLQATLFTPIAIYLGQLAGAEAWRAVGVQLAWLTLLSAAVVLVWRRGIRRAVVQGG